ncbi:50S ribosomal protein L18 [bacterium]
MERLTRNKKVRKTIRKRRIRAKIFGTSQRPRLVLNRSLKYLYAQIIDDTAQNTLLGFSTLCPEIKDKLKNHKNKEAAGFLGAFIGGKAVEKGIKKLVFDRNGRQYCLTLKAFVDAVREKGIGV